MEEREDVSIGQMIREAREKKGLSQTDLAKLMGVTRATVNGLESDRSSPSFKTLQKVAKALRLPLQINLG